MWLPIFSVANPFSRSCPKWEASPYTPFSSQNLLLAFKEEKSKIWESQFHCLTFASVWLFRRHPGVILPLIALIIWRPFLFGVTMVTLHGWCVSCTAVLIKIGINYQPWCFSFRSSSCRSSSVFKGGHEGCGGASPRQRENICINNGDWSCV